MAEGLLLSIAIPTYNRSGCLGMLLESICRQIVAKDVPRLEVLVLDNCSGDETSAVVRHFLPDRSYLHYVRNEQNIGADNNFVKAFSEAQGKYLWIIGDDELLFDGAVRWVLDLCAQRDFGCAYLYSVPDVLDKMPGYLGRRIPPAVECRAYSPYAFAQAANYRLTFLSGSVINRAAVIETNQNLGEDIEKFAGSNLVHLSWIFSAALSRPVSYIATSPLFASTVANSGGYNPVKVFVVNLSELFGYCFDRVAPGAKRFIRWFTLIGWFPKVTFDWRFRGRYQATGYVISREEFPAEMRSGLAWRIFDRLVLRGPMVLSALGAVLLKLAHKFLQRQYLRRGIPVKVG
jgi:abequosyltransferase